MITERNLENLHHLSMLSSSHTQKMRYTIYEEKRYANNHDYPRKRVAVHGM
jgi:hypothetical protein